MSYAAAAYNHYKRADTQAAVDADPHRLIEMLYGGLLSRLAKARVACAKRDRSEFGNNISKAIAIIGGLRDSLNPEGGEIAERLDALYRYSTERLLQASLAFDSQPLEEVSGLIFEIKSAWDEVRQHAF